MAFTPAVTKDGNGATFNVQAFQDASSNSAAVVSLDSNIPMYCIASSFTPQATAAVTVLSIAGSASKTVRIHRVVLGGSATALSSTLFKLVKTSALGAGGTAVNPTIAKLDSSSATSGVAAAGVAHYTTSLKAAGTPLDGDLLDFQLFQTTVTTPTVAYNEPQVVWPPRGVPGLQAIVLRGVAQFLEVQNANGGNLASGSILQYSVIWSEDAS